MIMKRIIQFTAAAALAFGLYSCDSDPLEDMPEDVPTTTFQSVDELLSDMEPEVSSFTVDASTGGTFNTNRGSEITIPANAFVDGSGQTVTGNVDLEFQEIFNASDAITSGAFTISNGIPIGTGGAFFIGAEQNGQALGVSPGQSVQVQIPSQQTNQAMQLFTGGTSINTSPQWTPLDTAQFWAWMNVVGNYFNVNMNRLMWVNCDYFTNPSWEDPVHFDLLGRTGLNSTNSQLFVVEQSNLATYPLQMGSNFSFMNSEVRNAKCNSGVSQVVVALAIYNNTIYLGHTTITPAAGTTYPIQMAAVTQADLQAFLNSL